MDRSLIEASWISTPTPWGTFRQVTLPHDLPAIVAGFLLSFTFSLDDFVIAFFVAGSTTTLPIYVFSSIRRGVTPEINAIGTTVMVFSLTVLFTAQMLLRRGAEGEAGEAESYGPQGCAFTGMTVERTDLSDPPAPAWPPGRRRRRRSCGASR